MAQFVLQYPGSGRVPEPQSPTVMRQDLGRKPQEIRNHPILCAMQGATLQQKKAILSPSHQSPAPPLQVFKIKLRKKALKAKCIMKQKTVYHKTLQTPNKGRLYLLSKEIDK